MAKVPALSPQTSSRIREALTIREVQAELGVGRTTVYQWIRKHGLPARKIGGKVLILREDLATWVDSQPGWNLDKQGA